MKGVIDSLELEPERDERFVMNCPWVSVIKKNAEVNTVFERPCGDIGFGCNFDDPEDYYPQTTLPRGGDFVKKCDFVYIPGKLFNKVIR